MNLTDAQKATIEYFGLEVVETDRYNQGEWLAGSLGGIWMSNTGPGVLTSSVVVRPRHAARIAELEAELRTNQNAVDLQRKALESAEAEIKTLRLKNHSFEPLIEQYEAELAPVRALNVGSWQWALMQYALNRHVRDRRGDKIDVTINAAGAPFTLHVEPEPEPEPTAAELAAKIRAVEEAYNSPTMLCTDRLKELFDMAARVKRKEGGK